MKRNNGYRHTNERQAYIDRHEPKHLPIVGDIIAIGRYRGQNVEKIREKDPGWFRWACENVQEFQFLADQATTRHSLSIPRRRKSRGT